MTKLRLNRWPRKMNPSAAPLTSNYEQDTVQFDRVAASAITQNRPMSIT